jgi:hypothetical protein
VALGKIRRAGRTSTELAPEASPIAISTSVGVVACSSSAAVRSAKRDASSSSVAPNTWFLVANQCVIVPVETSSSAARPRMVVAS